MVDVDQGLIDALYAGHPDGFVAARDEAVAARRAAGDQAGAREVAKLRKPTVAAWLVNLLALRRPELVTEFVELSAALRAAQRELRGARLRELSAQRRDAVAALVAETRALATEATGGTPTGKLPLAEVEATLTAALADAEVAERVRSGRLIRAASYAGFGEVPRPQLRLLTGGAGAEPAGVGTVEVETTIPPTSARLAGEQADRTRTATEDRTGRAQPGRAQPGRERAAREREAQAARERAERARQRRALSKELTRAQREQERAEKTLAEAVTAVQESTGRLTEIEGALADLERQRAAAEAEIGRNRLARKAAERDAVAARRRAGEIEAAVEALDADDAAAQR
ncbi:hypothetical protein ACWDV4_03550 [Micromonospora sp. NPDC003197]